MEEKTLKLCEEFIENRDVIKKVFRAESIFVYPVAANALSSHGVKADEAKLRECKKLVKKNIGNFSYLRGNVSLPFAANLSLKDDPKAHIEKVKRVYEYAKNLFRRSEYTALLAIMLADLVEDDRIEAVLDRGKEIYDLMKSQHPFLTDEQNSVFAGLLALSRKNNMDLIDDMEKCYDLLKIKFSHKSSIQLVSHVLSLTDGSASEKVNHLIELYDTLKQAGKKYGVYTQLSTLASVSILDNDTDKLRDTIIEIDDFLSKQKGYGILGIDKKNRLMHATMLTTDLYGTAQEAMATLSTSAIAMAAAQQLAICIIISTALSASSYYDGN